MKNYTSSDLVRQHLKIVLYFQNESIFWFQIERCTNSLLHMKSCLSAQTYDYRDKRIQKQHKRIPTSTVFIARSMHSVYVQIPIQDEKLRVLIFTHTIQATANSTQTKRFYRKRRLADAERSMHYIQHVIGVPGLCCPMFMLRCVTVDVSFLSSGIL